MDTFNLRPALAGAGVLALALSLTGAALVVRADYPVVFDGSQNRFDYVAAASADPEWTPIPSDWVDASTTPIVLDLADAEALEPGEFADFVVAVRNDGPLPGDLTVRIEDPDASEEESFFQQLIFTVDDGARTILDGQISAFRHSWAAFGPGETRILNVRITLPHDLDPRWQDKNTAIRIKFEGTNL